MITYTEWEAAQNISPLSAEAFYAEKAWNAALDQVDGCARLALEAEGGDYARALLLVQTEIDLLKTE